MGLNREEKAGVVEEVSAEVAQAGAIVVAEYRGLEVGAITALRRQARLPRSPLRPPPPFLPD